MFLCNCYSDFSNDKVFPHMIVCIDYRGENGGRGGWGHGGGQWNLREGTLAGLSYPQ